MKKCVLLFCLTCCAIANVLSKQLPDLSMKDSVGILLELARIKMDTDPATAAVLAQRAHSYAQQSDFTPGQADALFTLGRAHFKLHQSSESITAFQKAVIAFQKEKDEIKEGTAYHCLSNVYIYELNNYTKGFEYSRKAMKLLHHDSAALQPVLGNLAALYLQTKKPDEALALFQHIYTYWQKHNKLSGMANALNNMATVYEEKKDFKQSIHYYRKALEINTSLKSYSSSCTTMLGLANSYCQINEHEQSERLLYEILSIARSNTMTTMQLQACLFLAEEKIHRGDSKAALQFSLQAEKLSHEKQLTAFNTTLYEQLSRIYKANGDLVHALEYHQKYSALKDASTREEHIALAESVDQFNTSLQEASGYQKSSLLVIAFLVLFASMAAVVYLVRRKRPDVVLKASSTPTVKEELSAATNVEWRQDEILSPTITPAPKLEVIHGEGVKLLSLHTVWWFQKEGKSYHAFTESESYRVKQNIGELEEALPKGKFFRVNRAAIINTSYMSNYSFWENHKYIIRMKDEKKSSFTISRNRLRELKDTLQQLSEN